MSTRAEIELLAMKVAGIISQFKTPSHERGVLNGAVEELRRLAAEVETLRAAVKQARIDALEEAKTLIENYPFLLTAKAEICSAIELLKGTP